jgi:hypothetical protein
VGAADVDALVERLATCLVAATNSDTPFGKPCAGIRLSLQRPLSPSAINRHHDSADVGRRAS